MVLNRGGSKQMSREIVLKQAIIAVVLMAFLALGFPRGAGAANPPTPLPAWTYSPGAIAAQKLCTDAFQSFASVVATLDHSKPIPDHKLQCRPPDFSTTSWSVVLVVGAQVEKITTRGGTEYISAGPAAGLSVSPVSPTVSYGWLWSPTVGATPSESQIDAFVSGWGAYESDNIGVGFAVLQSPTADGDRGTYSRFGVAVTIGPSSGVEVGVGFSVKRASCTITTSTIDCPPAPPIHIDRVKAKPVKLCGQKCFPKPVHHKAAPKKKVTSPSPSPIQSCGGASPCTAQGESGEDISIVSVKTLTSSDEPGTSTPTLAVTIKIDNPSDGQDLTFGGGSITEIDAQIVNENHQQSDWLTSAAYGTESDGRNCLDFYGSTPGYTVLPGQTVTLPSDYCFALTGSSPVIQLQVDNNAVFNFSPGISPPPTTTTTTSGNTGNTGSAYGNIP